MQKILLLKSVCLKLSVEHSTISVIPKHISTAWFQFLPQVSAFLLTSLITT